MPEPDPSTNPRYVAMAKDCLAVAREALLVAGFLMLLLLPERFNGLLERAGFTKGSLLGFEWEKAIKASSDQAKGAGDAISQVEGRLKDFVAQLEALDKKTTDPNVRSAIASISRDVQASLQETAKADRAAKSSLLTQQQLIAQVTPASSTEVAGWMYLGKTDGPEGRWLSGSPETIETVPTSALKPGARVRARDDVYLRADSASGQHNEGRVLSVLSRGQEVEILAIQYPSRPWGAAAWAKVKR
jgi:hypothetical protein